MKKKVITALLITMTLTLGGVGTAYAMNNDMSILSGEAVNDVNMIKEGFIWVVDKESWTETVEHPEEGHYENGKLLEPEKGHYETVEIKPAWEENKWVEDKPAWVEEIKHPEEGHNEIRNICHNCGADITGHAMEHITNPENISNGCMSYGNKEVWIVDKEAWTEYKEHPAEGHTEIIKHPAVTDDVWVVDKEAVYEQIWKVDKPAWTETITHPEEGHWEPVKDEEKPEQKPDEEKPETPEQKPDEEKPETPEQKPDEEKPGTPEQKPDEETPETPEQKPDEEKPETPEQKPDEEIPENSENSNTENTSKDKTDNKTDNKTDSKKEETNTAPQTGDPPNLAYLATLAGSALVGGVSWKFRKRK